MTGRVADSSGIRAVELPRCFRQLGLTVSIQFGVGNSIVGFGRMVGVRLNLKVKRQHDTGNTRKHMTEIVLEVRVEDVRQIAQLRHFRR
jgi:hypothetical protein